MFVLKTKKCVKLVKPHPSVAGHLVIPDLNGTNLTSDDYLDH